MKRWIVRIALLLLVVTALAYAFKPQPVTVETAVVRQGVFESTVDEDGLIRVRSRYLVASPTAGRADRIVLEVGDTVKPGDLITSIRPLPPSLQDARIVSELNEAVGAARAGEMRARAQVARSRAALQNARNEYQRAIELANQGFTSRSTADSAQSLLVQQQQALKAAEFEYQAAQHQTRMALAAAQQAGGNPGGDDSGGPAASNDESSNQNGDPRGLVAVTAPVSGQVLQVLRESEGPVSSGTGLVEIGDTNRLEAVIDVLSEDATALRPAMPVRLDAGRGIDTLFGQVVRVEPVAKTRVSTLGVEEQRVNVIVELSGVQAPQVLGDGYRVDASIVTRSERNALLVPIGALIRTGTGWQVFVVNDKQAELRPVEISARNNNEVWLGSGVTAGEKVIVYPPDSLEPGDMVKETL